MDTFCSRVRKDILRISHHSGHGHIPSCFSVVEMISAAYSVMKHNPSNPQWDQRDIFILSKGHAALAHYCILAYLGYFPISDLYSFGKFGSDFGCHADRHKVPGVEWSTGSLGHGNSVAVGIALSFKIRNSSRKVIVLIGDGEANEGTVWESLLVAANLRLDNLYFIFDNNKSQIRCLPITKPLEKFRAFDCETVEVNGHNVVELKEALLNAPAGYASVL